MSDRLPPADAAAPRAVVVGHGDLAAGLVSAVAQITGRGEQLLALTNRGRGAEEMEAALRAALARASARTVFTDLPGGSWTIAARRVQRAEPDVVVISGVSLPILLDWMGRDDEPPPSAAHAAAERGRACIMVTGGTPPAAGTGGADAH